MDYSIAKGDNLWNIVKNNYDCKSNQEISDTIDLIVKENNIKDRNTIFAGDSITLPETDSFVKKEERQEDKTNADLFDEWTNSQENYDKALAGEDVAGFKMFDIDLQTYSSDLKGFAQEYVNKYDGDDDGKWNKSEFIAMAGAGEEVPDEYLEQMNDLYDELFAGLNIDADKDNITAEEFASFLYTADLDWENYNQTSGDVASSIDGNLDYLNYQALSSLISGDEGYETLRSEKQDFFENFYAE